MKYNGEACPKCGETLRTTSSLAFTDTMTAYQAVQCRGCNTEFNEVFKVTVLEEVDKDGRLLNSYPSV
jgi:uncharacterized protein with PIN domain